MKVILSSENLRAIESHGESTYPNEGAGFLLGKQEGDYLRIEGLLPIENKWEADEQYHRYVLTSDDFMRAELEAAKRGLDMVGVFHSHPDHPAEPSVYDRDWAMPNFSYFISSIVKGSAKVTYSWRLRPDRTAFDSEPIEVLN
jgi:proteasome lid subunit RPN8/RPN11